MCVIHSRLSPGCFVFSLNLCINMSVLLREQTTERSWSLVSVSWSLWHQSFDTFFYSWWQVSADWLLSVFFHWRMFCLLTEQNHILLWNSDYQMCIIHVSWSSLQTGKVKYTDISKFYHISRCFRNFYAMYWVMKSTLYNHITYSCYYQLDV